MFEEPQTLEFLFDFASKNFTSQKSLLLYLPPNFMMPGVADFRGNSSNWKGDIVQQEPRRRSNYVSDFFNTPLSREDDSHFDTVRSFILSA